MTSGGAGAELELGITTVAHGGVFVARHEGRVVFVSDAIPGERVLARVTDDSHASFWRADTVRVIEPSPDRRAHVWREADVDRDPVDRPGGAEFGHIRPERQRALKRQVVEENLARMTGRAIEAPLEAVSGEADGTGWRTRVRLHVDADGRVGPYAARSHDVVEVTDLPLAVPELREIAPLGERLVGVDAVDLVAPGRGMPRVLAVPGGRDAREPVLEEVAGRVFRVDAGGFWQVHREAARTLSAAVAAAVEGDLFDPRAANLDLYGGVGLLAAAVADRFGPATTVTTVEADARATEHALHNLADLPRARASTARVDRFLRGLRDTGEGARSRAEAATVVLDPPRAGAGKQVVAELARLRPAQIVYVACDPVALARDLAGLERNGYSATSVRAFDLFPNTHHVEAIATLVRD